MCDWLVDALLEWLVHVVISFFSVPYCSFMRCITDSSFVHKKPEPFVLSDADEQLIFQIPFGYAVKIKSIMVIGGGGK